jgi:hypothetical protein
MPRGNTPDFASLHPGYKTYNACPMPRMRRAIAPMM